jgi:hypothetical protein
MGVGLHLGDEVPAGGTDAGEVGGQNSKGGGTGREAAEDAQRQQPRRGARS